MNKYAELKHLIFIPENSQVSKIVCEFCMKMHFISNGNTNHVLKMRNFTSYQNPVNHNFVLLYKATLYQ